MKCFSKYYLALPIFGVMALTGCTSSDEPGSSNTIPEDEIIPFPIFTLTEEQQAVADIENAFSIEFFADVAKDYMAKNKKENFAVSPISAAMCMSMLANSVDESTCGPILETLGVSDMSALNDYNSMLINNIQFYNNQGVLKLLNNMWYHNSAQVTADYTNLMESVFHLTPAARDFADPKTVDEINQWAFDASYGNIPEIIKKTEPAQALVLANALYFRSEWAKKFDKSLTKLSPFKGFTETVNVPMMHKDCEVMPYTNLVGAEVAVMYFKENNSYLFLILPPEDEDIYKFASNLTSDKFNLYKKSLTAHEVKLDMPRFSLDMDYDMSSYLVQKSISLQHTFSQIGLGDKPVGMTLSHHTSVEVNEDGAVVAAVTNSDLFTALPGATMTLNRPFLYFILERNTMSVIIAGIVADLDNADTL